MNNGAPSSRIIQVIETSFSRGFGIEEDVCRGVVRYFDFDGNLLAEKDDCPSDDGFDAREYVRRVERDAGLLEHMANELAASKIYKEWKEKFPNPDAEVQAKMDGYIKERGAQRLKDFLNRLEKNKGDTNGPEAD